MFKVKDIMNSNNVKSDIIMERPLLQIPIENQQQNKLKLANKKRQINYFLEEQWISNNQFLVEESEHFFL